MSECSAWRRPWCIFVFCVLWFCGLVVWWYGGLVACMALCKMLCHYAITIRACRASFLFLLLRLSLSLFLIPTVYIVCTNSQYRIHIHIHTYIAQ